MTHSAGLRVGLALAACVLLGSGCGAAAQQRRDARFREPLATRSRGYLTTPEELSLIAEKARLGREPYRGAVEEVLDWANRDWSYRLRAEETCPDADRPEWNDDRGGTAVLYAKALAYHLTGVKAYAESVRGILERIMTEVRVIATRDLQCQLNFAWGTAELVAAADLIEDDWKDSLCEGPLSSQPGNDELGRGHCKVLFQNWLVKNPYYVLSEATTRMAGNNWGAAATNAAMHVVDYLWDRPDLRVVHRNAEALDAPRESHWTPAEAWSFLRALTLDRMNMERVSWTAQGCDNLTGPDQSDRWPPVKSGITENGIVSEDARREEYCNVPRYDGSYQNYPEIHLGNLIQQCELMFRRGDSACYDNVADDEIREYRYLGPDGRMKTTHLHPGRGSLERAIDAIIIDAGAPWRRPGALRVAYRYYWHHRRRSMTELARWERHLGRGAGGCFQDICFGGLTHGFELREIPPRLPPVVMDPPGPPP